MATEDHGNAVVAEIFNTARGGSVEIFVVLNLTTVSLSVPRTPGVLLPLVCPCKNVPSRKAAATEDFPSWLFYQLYREQITGNSPVVPLYLLYQP